MGRERAVFVDRDGVLNDLVYDREEGRVSSPFSVRELRVFPYVPEAVKRIREGMGFKVIVISNQPGVSKRQFTHAEFERMNAKVRKAVREGGSAFDAEYYCLHHPHALVKKYRVDCDCRKPKPGMLLHAAEENDIDLRRSYFIGDALVDVKAGQRAGCRTVLVGHFTTMLGRMMEREGATPDYMISSLRDAPSLLIGLGERERAGPRDHVDATRPVQTDGRTPPERARTAHPERRTASPRKAGPRTSSPSPWTLCG